MKSLIFLVGARGSGKTYVGSYLASQIGHRFYDTDELICNRSRQSIKDIVNHYGWSEFRRLEKSMLLECSKLDQAVVATGGGAVLHREIWPEIKSRAFVIWLSAATETLVRRIETDEKSGDSRPSLTGAKVADEFSRVMEERLPLYEGVADVIIDTDSLDRDGIVADIVLMMERQNGIF